MLYLHIFTYKQQDIYVHSQVINTTLTQQTYSCGHTHTNRCRCRCIYADTDTYADIDSDSDSDKNSFSLAEGYRIMNSIIILVPFT